MRRRPRKKLRTLVQIWDRLFVRFIIGQDKSVATSDDFSVVVVVVAGGYKVIVVVVVVLM